MLLRVIDIRRLLLLLPQEGNATTINVIYPEVLLQNSMAAVAAIG